MTDWSQGEAGRTLEEVKRRSIVDPEFRALALSDAGAAVAKVNPRPLPPGFMVKFVDNGDQGNAAVGSGSIAIIVLPDPIGRMDELSDAELDQAAGGDDGTLPLKLRS